MRSLEEQKRANVIKVIKCRRKKKLFFVEYFGGKCTVEGCEYNKCPDALEFHHLKPKNGSPSPTTIIGQWSKKRALEELKTKCILVCSNCHKEIHYKLNHLGR